MPRLSAVAYERRLLRFGGGAKGGQLALEREIPGWGHEGGGRGLVSTEGGVILLGRAMRAELLLLAHLEKNC